MLQGSYDGPTLLQRLSNVLLRGAQRVEVAARAQWAGTEQHLSQWRRVRQALQNAVHEAGIAQVLQSSTLHTISSALHTLPATLPMRWQTLQHADHR